MSHLDKKRIEIKNQWALAATKICERVQDAEAQIVLEKIVSNLLTVAPVPQGIMFVEESEHKRGNMWVAFLPLLLEDSDKEWVRHLMNRNGFAMYHPDNNTISVRDFEPCSEVWKGIMMLHEAHHAGDMLFLPYDWRNPQTFSEKERDVHNFQNRFLSLMDGSVYQDLLEKEIARMRAFLDQQGFDGMKKQVGSHTNIVLPNRTEYYPELDEILTPSLCDFEKDCRQTHFWIHAIFTMYERDRGEGMEAEVGKAAFLQAIYRRGGVI